jgi:tRNA-modifying protein YgfZ
MWTEAVLKDRGVVEVSGPDAVKFLHNIVTNTISTLEPGEARFAALLAPQGKILFDFLVFAQDGEDGRRLLLDCPKELVADLTRRLSMYKLRADVTIANRSDEVTALAIWGADGAPEIEALALATDPRAPALGWRALVVGPRASDASADEAYEALRIEAGVPKGGVDFKYNDAFPHEANMDRLSGVDFKKGCFIGQEVVSRMKHRNTVRTRVTPFQAQGATPAQGARILDGEIEIGVIGSTKGSKGLALVRLDKAEAARAAGRATLADGIALELGTTEG